MDPLEEARYKNIILRYLQTQRNRYIDYKVIADQKELDGVSETTVSHLLKEMEYDDYVRTGSTKDSPYAGYISRADYFLENGGYEAQYIVEQSSEVAEEMKYRKIEKQEGFIRFVRVIKSSVWLVGFIISLILNIYFIIKFWLKLF